MGILVTVFVPNFRSWWTGTYVKYKLELPWHKWWELEPLPGEYTHLNTFHKCQKIQTISLWSRGTIEQRKEKNLKNGRNVQTCNKKSEFPYNFIIADVNKSPNDDWSASHHHHTHTCTQTHAHAHTYTLSSSLLICSSSTMLGSGREKISVYSCDVQTWVSNSKDI